ncbi:3-deoxy-D-manno-octulosonic-acid transferase [Granulicella rosea]|uniref:3-deoxy-D-manno-octulosonic acid transferase n=1 Tax=Granulicella rosea TaxID=474952 RepID=A0A239JNP5_9BACT|nr:3-deoxy-D-manno-octulosonic acid transferase [Granulicella rosea]SNT07058.1 3-deoxy-D-manno-octulosonic-acid transferase [Granulicella rosea]
MILYSALLTAVLVLGSPWWLWRMATSGRYRAGLSGRLGVVPAGLKAAVAGKDVVWVHCVSVGEVLGAARLIAELQAALPGYVVAVSTTTQTGQEIARQKLPGTPVFYMPLDLAFIVRRYLNVLRPKLLVLMESELWPRLLVECERRKIPVAVVNARISDRSFPRYMKLRRLWKPLMAKVTLFLAQGEETAERLRMIGAPPQRVRVAGNLKFDLQPAAPSKVADRIRELADGRPIIVAGSTCGTESSADEETMLLEAWQRAPREKFGALLVIAPRHTQRFAVVESALSEFHYLRVSDWSRTDGKSPRIILPGHPDRLEIILLNTIGDLADVYRIADIAFVGGSLIPRGGHNPLEPARFGVPVTMGPFHQNFREIVHLMSSEDGLREIVTDDIAGVEEAFADLLSDTEDARRVGERGQAVYKTHSGATPKTAQILVDLIVWRKP